MDAEALVFVVEDDAPRRESLQDRMRSVGLRVTAHGHLSPQARQPRGGPAGLV
jgi:FixJ family two-component response regulator